MKSQFQILSFLSNYSPKTELDHEMITSFVEKKYSLTSKKPIFARSGTNSPLDTQSFIQWYESGYGATEIAKYGDSLVLLGLCELDNVIIEGILEGKRIKQQAIPIHPHKLNKSSQEETQHFQIKLLENRLQFNSLTMSLMEKYIPSNREKVIFHNRDRSVKGLGVVRNINPETLEVELFCYFIYPHKYCQRQIGYSMHETQIVNLHEYSFEPMMEEDDENRLSSLNGVSCLKRLNRELNKEGKVWKDKLKRIEPLEMKAKKGEKYWYINDKLEVVQKIEKGTPTSHFRYLAGNYFVSQMAANMMLGEICDLIQGYLASPNWPEIY